MRAHTTPATTTHLFLLEELADVRRTRELAESALDALRAVADWITTFVARPHKDLGRAGPVCPFVPEAWARQTLWLAPAEIADRSVQDVVQLINGDCSGETGLPPTGVDRIVRVLTIEPGGPHDVRSRWVPTRPERRDHSAR